MNVFLSAFELACVMVVAASATGCGHEPSTPTAAEVLRECREAYGKLSAYSGTTTCTTKMSFAGSPYDMKSSARVQFIRPSKLRIDGTLMNNQGHFTIVTEGSDTWMTKIDGVTWEKASGVESAIATFTGVSGGAATTIPAILTGSNWGDALSMVQDGKVVSDSLEGRPVWRLDGSRPGGSVTLWINRDDHLLAKMTSKIDFSKLGAMTLPDGSKMPDSLKGEGQYEQIDTYNDIVVNGPIPGESFSRYWKPPHG